MPLIKPQSYLARPNYYQSVMRMSSLESVSTTLCVSKIDLFIFIEGANFAHAYCICLNKCVTFEQCDSTFNTVSRQNTAYDHINNKVDFKTPNHNPHDMIGGLCTPGPYGGLWGHTTQLWG